MTKALERLVMTNRKKFFAELELQLTNIRNVTHAGCPVTWQTTNGVMGGVIPGFSATPEKPKPRKRKGER
jgi:hypothetical protein